MANGRLIIRHSPFTMEAAMEGKRPERERDRDVHVDLSFGDLFKGIGNLVDLVTEMAQQGESEVRRTGEIKGLGKARGVYGFSVKMGLGGTPTVERFGNIRQTAEGPVVEDLREPMVDLFDEGDRVLVVAELPGVQEAAIQVQIEGDVLNLAAEGKDRKYCKELLLPFAVEPTPTKRSYQSGILEIELKKAGE